MPSYLGAPRFSRFRKAGEGEFPTIQLGSSAARPCIIEVRAGLTIQAAASANP